MGMLKAFVKEAPSTMQYLNVEGWGVVAYLKVLSRFIL
jgi:hypothetical protein